MISLTMEWHPANEKAVWSTVSWKYTRFIFKRYESWKKSFLQKYLYLFQAWVLNKYKLNLCERGYPLNTLYWKRILIHNGDCCSYHFDANQGDEHWTHVFKISSLDSHISDVGQAATCAFKSPTRSTIKSPQPVAADWDLQFLLICVTQSHQEF